MVDHATLLQQLSCGFGVSGVVHSWIESYLYGRTQSVRMGSHSSAVTPCTVGVPQGSVLGPLFSVYTSPLSTIAQSHQVLQQQQYTDDTQLSVALSPLNYSNEINTLQSCLSAIHVWFCKNGMALNPTKSDAILFGTSRRLKTMSSLSSVKLNDSVIQLSDTVKILGATLDSSLTMGPHTKATSKSCFYHIRSFIGKSVHLWITLWPSLLLLLWSLRDLIMLIPSCLVVHRSMRLVLYAYSRHSLEL